MPYYNFLYLPSLTKIKDLVNVGSKITDIADFTEEEDPAVIKKLSALSEDGE